MAAARLRELDLRFHLSPMPSFLSVSVKLTPAAAPPPDSDTKWTRPRAACA